MKVIKIGRASTNDIVINDPTASRIHCQIIEDNGTFRIMDLNSANGTFINGVRRGETILNRSDIVRIGNTTLPWLSYFNSGSPDPGNTVLPPGGGYPYPPQPPRNKPDSFLVWSILCTLCCCLPFGIVSIVYAIKVDSLWAAGDYDGAERAAQTARTWFWWGFGLGLLSALLSTIYYIVAVGAMFI